MCVHRLLPCLKFMEGLPHASHLDWQGQVARWICLLQPSNFMYCKCSASAKQLQKTSFPHIACVRFCRQDRIEVVPQLANLDPAQFLIGLSPLVRSWNNCICVILYQFWSGSHFRKSFVELSIIGILILAMYLWLYCLDIFNLSIHATYYVF